MSPDLKISILTPVYNEERFLSTMIDSMRSQTHDNWELLLVDDGSTDSTAQIITSWSAKDERIKAVSLHEKLGKVAAFNTAFAASTGDLICHVGGDDILPSDSLSIRASALANAPETAVLLGKLQMVDLNIEPISRPFPRGVRGSQSSGGATYTRKLASLLFPIPEALPSEDIWLGNGAVGCAQEVRHTPSTIYLYRIHTGNSNPRHKSFAEMNESIRARSSALQLLVDSPHLPLDDAYRAEIDARVIAERARYEGRIWDLVRQPNMRPIDKIALISASRPSLWRLRQRIGATASGWRGR